MKTPRKKILLGVAGAVAIVLAGARAGSADAAASPTGAATSGPRSQWHTLFWW